MPVKGNKKSSKKTLLIIGITFVAIIILASTSYLIYTSIHKNNSNHNQNFRMYRNFTVNNETLSQTMNLFNNAANMQTIISYCQGMNMFYCRYYCMQINSSNSFCSQLPMPAYSGNYSMMGGQQ